MKLKKCALMGAFVIAVSGLAGCGPNSGSQKSAPQAPPPYTGEKVDVKGYSRSILEFTPQNAPDKVCVAIAGQESGGVACFTPDPNAQKLPALKILASYETTVGDYTRSIVEFTPKSDASKLCVGISGQESSGVTCFSNAPATKPPTP